jgi:hypothetical protein
MEETRPGGQGPSRAVVPWSSSSTTFSRTLSRY